jgi:hypothetical protein
MPASAWQLVDNVATLRTPGLFATVDPRQPALGMQIEKLCGDSTAPIRLFGVQIDSAAGFEPPPLSAPPTNDAAPDTPLDCFVRGNDLIATYAETANRPFRAQVYWRLVEPEVDPVAATLPVAAACELNSAPRIAALEIIVSVQTSRLDVETALAVCTTIGHVESWQLLDADDRAFAPGAMPTALRGHASLDPSPPSNPILAAANSPARELTVPDFRQSDSRDCCLIRPTGLSLAYLEMVHPADFRQTTFEWPAKSPPVARLTHRLFAERLEKGVILRSRIRGIFLPRTHAEELARQEFRRFADSKLPLTA